jgi:hypothetical protein
VRITIFDDNGVELATAAVSGLKLDARTRRVDIAATVINSWRPLPEGGKSAAAVTAALMDHLVESGKIEVSYTRPPALNRIEAVGL